MAPLRRAALRAGPPLRAGRGERTSSRCIGTRRLNPNVDPDLLAKISSVHAEAEASARPVAVEDLLAYCFALLAGADYTERFRTELETPGPRVPITAEGALFREVVEFGYRLIWLQTFGERFAAAYGLGPFVVAGNIQWSDTLNFHSGRLQRFRI